MSKDCKCGNLLKTIDKLMIRIGELESELFIAKQEIAEQAYKNNNLEEKLMYQHSRGDR
jgi:hypothetical protein